MRHFSPVVLLLVSSSVFAQTQVCPVNNSFSLNSLTHWEAYTSLSGGVKQIYDSAASTPNGTIGNSLIYEYNLPTTPGIQILDNSTTDPFGNFPTVPRINGYQYSNSVLLGSTAISRNGGGPGAGGYVRGISYRISVPAGPVTEPYTMTYAYAMVLENGTHNSNQQPLFSATLTTNDSVITCASPQYFLPTFDNTTDRGTGAVLDSALAKSEGFFVSQRLSPNANPNSPTPQASHLQDVWFKGWTEVTFDLSPFRGQQVTLTFETDNCVPGGHFAYSYVALRNVCAGLQISGFSVACTNSILTYSIPGLTGATYQWAVPAGWSIVAGTDSSVMQVRVGTSAGTIMAFESNSCANLKDTLNVTTTPPTIAGAVLNNAEVCAGANSSILNLNGNRGGVLNWISSVNNGVTWSVIDDATPSFSADNLAVTTLYRALVQNAASCDIDTSSGAVIQVDPKSVGGKLSPSSLQFCLGQNKDALLVLSGQTGDPLNWQLSPDAVIWSDFAPDFTQTQYSILGLTQSADYRVVVKSGVCPADTSTVANIKFIDVQFPQASYEPADTSICYGTKATLNASISIGTNYNWSNTNTLTNTGSGTVVSSPDLIAAIASPLDTTNYILSIENAGCPNLLVDTFHVKVIPPILVDAGNDTSIVINQPLQLHASSNDTTGGGDRFLWTPAIGLNDVNIANPVAVLNAETDSVHYIVKATSAYGCFGLADIVVHVFRTGPDIFVPNAFTPGGATNNIFRPIAVGIASLQYFKIYNRWGQLVYATTTLGQGWDGRMNGQLVASGTFVWIVQGTTYTKKLVYHKGTMTMVR